MNVKKDTIVFKDKPDIKPELDAISETKEEIKKMMEIIKQKEDTIRLKQEQELREKRELSFQIATKELEQLIDTINYFKRTPPFNYNLTFMKRLIDFYNHLDKYEKSPVYKTEKVEEINEARDLMRRIKQSGNGALNVLGDQTYRTLLKYVTDKFQSLEEEIKSLVKKVNKLG